jgi:hypothetical protein
MQRMQAGVIGIVNMACQFFHATEIVGVRLTGSVVGVQKPIIRQINVVEKVFVEYADQMIGQGASENYPMRRHPSRYLQDGFTRSLGHAYRSCQTVM